MENGKLKIWDRVKTKCEYIGISEGVGGVVVGITHNGYYEVKIEKGLSNNDDYGWMYLPHEVELVKGVKPSIESRSKQISQSLKQICTKGLVIKSEDIIAKVKGSIGTEYVFGDTILRALRHLRQDGILDYTADKHTREYTFK